MIYLSHFILGFFSSYLGTIPPGPINLSVVDATIKQSLKVARIMAFGAALVEILQCIVALNFGLLVIDTIDNSPYIRISIFVIFVLIGLLFFFKKEYQTKPKDEEKKKKQNASTFIKGAIIGALNPQAIPFYVFFLALYRSLGWFVFELDTVLFFVIGISLGKFLSLLSYAYLSRIIVKRVSSLSLWINKILGVVLIIIGLMQIVKYIF